MVVVGGGVMGSATAWALARRGVDVVLLERFGPGHAHGASHGRARIYRSTYAQPHHQALVAEARALWGELEEESGVRVLHPAPGVTTAAPSQSGRLREIAVAMTAAGVPHEWLPVAEAEQRWPGMRFPGPVLHEPATAGRVDAYLGPNPNAVYQQSKGAVSIVGTVNAGWPNTTYVAATTLKGNGLVDAVEAGLQHVFGDGSYAKTLARWGLSDEAVDAPEVNPQVAS